MVNIPKGTKDILPEESYRWQYLEDTARRVAHLYNLKEIRTPVFEHTELFERGIGETTDVVNKEMYTFLDKGGRSITLKPEGTAGAVRAYIESLSGAILPVKMFYFTPVFRYERPQAGRLREHHQFGVELFGSYGAEMDVEAILIAKDFLERIGLNNLELNINSIGSGNCRIEYNRVLKDYLIDNASKLCPLCQERIEKNPLRALDCKEVCCHEITLKAPKTIDYLDEQCCTHFESVQNLLKSRKINFKVNPYVVRGLDYYTKTVFEFVSDSIGAKSTVCAGGRYDNLIESLGGKSVPAVGFGLGLERMLLALDSGGISIPDKNRLDVFVAITPEIQSEKALDLTQRFRAAGLSADYDQLRRSLKSQFKYADKVNAKFVLTLGENEIKSGIFTIKNMQNGKQITAANDNLTETILKELKKENNG